MTDLRMPALGLPGLSNQLPTCIIIFELWHELLPDEDLLEVSCPMTSGLSLMISAGGLVTERTSNSLDEALAVDIAGNSVDSVVATDVIIFLPGQTLCILLQFYYGCWDSLMDQQMDTIIVRLERNEFAQGALAVMTLDESLQIMETMDAIRAQWGMKYPME